MLFSTLKPISFAELAVTSVARLGRIRGWQL